MIFIHDICWLQIVLINRVEWGGEWREEETHLARMH